MMEKPLLAYLQKLSIEFYSLEEESEELARLPWYQNYRYLALGLLLLTALVVGYFA